MRVTVELTYDMIKAMGCERFEVDDVETVADLLDKARGRIGPSFEQHTRLAAVAVNGVLVNHLRGRSTRLGDGDRITFVKASAGG
jgi:thiamine biosynthesis protein ThiS